MKHKKMRETYPEFNCTTCKTNTLHNGEYYMLNDKLWRKIADNKNGMMCIGCVETKLKRQLTRKDFTDAPVNNLETFNKSDRLIDRLTS